MESSRAVDTAGRAYPRTARLSPPMDDRSTGLAIFVCATALFAYYTVWVLVTPFIEPGHVVLSWFPDRVYAILIPAYAGACLVALVLALLGGVMLRARPGRASSDKKTR